MTKIRLLLKGSAFQTIEVVVAIIAGMVTLPMMLTHLGADTYGIWILVAGFSNLLYIFDFGFATSVTRGVAKSISEGDEHKTNAIINSALLIYTGLALMICATVIGIAVFYNPDISELITHRHFQMLILIVGFSIAFEFPFKAFSGLTTAHLRYDILASYRILIRLLNTAALILLVTNNYGLVAIAILQFATGATSSILFFLTAKGVYKELKISSRLIDATSTKELLHYSVWAFLIDINRILKERIDIFFIGGFISLSAVSIYYIPVRLVEYTLQLLYKALNLSLPILTASCAAENNAKFREDLLLFNRINSYFSVLTLLFFILFGQSILYYWMGSEFDYKTAYSILLILLAGRMSALSSSGFNNGLYARAQHKLIAYLNIGEAIATATLLAIVLAWLKLGPTAAASAVAIPLLISRMFLLPLIASRIMKVGNVFSLLMHSYRPAILLLAGIIALTAFPLGGALSINHIWLGTIYITLSLTFLSLDLMPRERDLIYRTRAMFVTPDGKNELQSRKSTGYAAIARPIDRPEGE
jgi:O-antigen/teichoic acid export membrane protein